MADSKDKSLDERREEMQKRLEAMRKNPKTWFEFRLILHTPMEVSGQKTYCVSHAKMAVQPSDETGEDIQELPPILHEVALNRELAKKLDAVAKKAAAELRNSFVDHDSLLESVVRKLISEYMCHQWQVTKRDPEESS